MCVLPPSLNESRTHAQSDALWCVCTAGMTALSQAYCNERPLTCGAVQRALERSPGLRFIPGVGFRHAYDASSPSPPPPPLPPPRNLFCTCYHAQTRVDTGRALTIAFASRWQMDQRHPTRRRPPRHLPLSMKVRCETKTAPPEWLRAPDTCDQNGMLRMASRA
jgi:hypothetical protein